MAAQVATTLKACHAVYILGQTFRPHGKPENVGSQFTAKPLSMP
ncbi:hypothetical protein [Methylomonas sp.]|nr:hypothetical protein [Methylomonas sp.]